MASLTSGAQRGPRRDHALFERYCSTRDRASREALVERFLPLAQHLARQYPAGGEQEDLMQVASLALVKAIDRFDPSRGIAFTSFAVPTIVGELKRYFRDHGWAVRTPRDVQELAVRLGSVSEELTARLRRAPTPGELAEHCGSSIEQVLEALATETAHRPVSIDRPREEDGDGLAVQLGADDDAGYTRVDEASVVESLLDALPERERTILRLRFEQELTQREIGERIGMSQMQVSRLIRRSIAALHASATLPRPSRTRPRGP